MVLGLSSGVPGIYDVPEGNNNTNFAQSLNRIKVGINKNQVASTQPYLTLVGSFPYKPGDAVHFLGSKGRIGLGCIAEVCGSKYRIVHSGTRSTILANDSISPMEKHKKQHAKHAALSAILKTIGQENYEIIFQNGLKNISVKASCPLLKDIFFLLILLQIISIRPMNFYMTVFKFLQSILTKIKS